MRGGRPRHWGWHRLTPVAAERLVADAHIGRGDLVVDIGAGTGAITEQLLRRGARVIAVELHPARHAALVERFRDDDVVVVRADATDLRLPRRAFRVVANPPFAATTAVLSRLVAPGSRLVDAHLVLERGAAERWALGRAPGAGRWRRDFEVRLGHGIPRHHFVPPPPVACAELVVRRRG